MGVDLENLRLDLPGKPSKGKKEGRDTSSRWKILCIILALLLLAFIIYHFSNRGMVSGTVVVQTHTVLYSTGSGPSIFSAGGWVEPAFPYPVVVSSLLSGRIEKMNVVESAEVEEGENIAVLYQKDLKDALTKAEAELSFARATLDKLEAGYRTEEVEEARAVSEKANAQLTRLEAGFRLEEIEKARADLSEVQSDEDLKKSVWLRSEELLEEGAISREEADKDKALYESARSRSESVRQALQLLEHGYRKEDVEEARAEAQMAIQRLKLLESGYRKEEVAEAQAEFNRAAAAMDIARAHLSYTEIKAPLTGRVLELFAAQGDYVTAQKSAIVSLYNPSEIQVRVDVRQENVAKMRLGQRALVRTEARRDTPYEGKIIRIDPKANLARDTIRAKVQIIDPDETLYPEMTATVDFLEETAQDRESRKLMVPRAAVFSEQGNDFVFVTSRGQVEKVEVELGPGKGESFAILSGLSEGQEVAVTNIHLLQQGRAVRIQR